MNDSNILKTEPITPITITLSVHNIKCHCQIQKEYMNLAPQIKVWSNVEDSLTYQLKTYFCEKMISEKKVVFEFDKPSFLDWLFKRKRTFTKYVNIKDVFKDTPIIDENENYVRVYEISSFKGEGE